MPTGRAFARRFPQRAIRIRFKLTEAPEPLQHVAEQPPVRCPSACRSLQVSQFLGERRQGRRGLAGLAFEVNAGLAGDLL